MFTITLEPQVLDEQIIQGIRYRQLHGRSEDGDGVLVWIDISAFIWDEQFTLSAPEEIEDDQDFYSGETVRHVSPN